MAGCVSTNFDATSNWLDGTPDGIPKMGPQAMMTVGAQKGTTIWISAEKLKTEKQARGGIVADFVSPKTDS